MSERARRAFVPILGVAVLIASAIADPGASRSYSVVVTVSHVERDQWLELAPDAPFSQVRLIFTGDTVVTSDTGGHLNPALLQVGDRVGVVVTRSGGESRYIAKRVVRISAP
jgi:hypothetical protein